MEPDVSIIQHILAIVANACPDGWVQTVINVCLLDDVRQLDAFRCDV